MNVAAKFDPDWDLVYLHDTNCHTYQVVKKPEPIPGEDLDKLFVREGCTVNHDGQWWYWRLQGAEEFESYKEKRGLIDVTNNKIVTPDWVFSNRINQGNGTEGHPAPQFIGRDENNWIDGNPLVIPDHITSDMLGDLTLAHLMLSEYLQEGTPNPKTPKK